MRNLTMEALLTIAALVGLIYVLIFSAICAFVGDKDALFPTYVGHSRGAY